MIGSIRRTLQSFQSYERIAQAYTQHLRTRTWQYFSSSAGVVAIHTHQIKAESINEWRIFTGYLSLFLCNLTNAEIFGFREVGNSVMDMTLVIHLLKILCNRRYSRS